MENSDYRDDPYELALLALPWTMVNGEAVVSRDDAVLAVLAQSSHAGCNPECENYMSGLPCKKNKVVEMDDNEILHILRNPWGKATGVKRQTMLSAANRIEQLADAYENLREFYAQKGIDTTTTGTEA